MSQLLTPRHKTIAMWQAQGATERVLIEQLQVSAIEFEEIAHHAVYQKYVSDLQAAINSNGLDTVEDEIRSMRADVMRKGRELLHCGDTSVEKTIFKELFDRISPKVSKHEIDKTTRVVIEGDSLKGMFQTLIAVTGIDPAKLMGRTPEDQTKMLEEAVEGEQP